jgi:hypothetical protein
MPIQAPNPPTAALDAVRTAVRSFAEEAMFRTPALRAAQPEQLTINEPHQVFLLGLDDLRAGAGLTRARLVGWRYLVQEGEKVIATAESALAGRGDAQVFSNFNEGPFVASTAAALSMAKTDPRVSQGTYEQRLLHVPALYVMALWLHEPTGAGDLLVPLAPSPRDLPAGRPLPAGEVVTILTELARRIPAEAPNDIKGS